MTADALCYVLAIVCFVLAAFPTAVGNGKVRFECLGFAALTLSLLV